MKLNLFKLRKNKKFRYSPRYSKSEQQSNIYEFDSAYSKNRESRSVYDKSNSWTEARLNSRNRGNSSFSKTILFIFHVENQSNLSIATKWFKNEKVKEPTRV